MQIAGDYDQGHQRRQPVSRVWLILVCIERRLALIWINPMSGQQWEGAERTAGTGLCAHSVCSSPASISAQCRRSRPPRQSGIVAAVCASRCGTRMAS
jgi:hypothetical protein